MFILGVFLSAVLNINHMASYLENQVEMTVYLKDGLTTDQVMGIGKYLKAQPGMKEIKFTNKDQAKKDFRERMGDQQGLLDAINGNPLPASYQVIPLSGIVLIIFLAGAELFIISNTIRLTVFARRREIQIMKYVGASNGFIRWPFLFEGMVIGFLGSGFASLILWEGYKTVVSEMAAAGLVFIPMIPLWPFMGYTTLIILAAGIVIGVMGSAISLRKYMKV